MPLALRDGLRGSRSTKCVAGAVQHFRVLNHCGELSMARAFRAVLSPFHYPCAYPQSRRGIEKPAKPGFCGPRFSYDI
jgi:hypothetical protein